MKLSELQSIYFVVLHCAPGTCIQPPPKTLNKNSMIPAQAEL